MFRDSCLTTSSRYPSPFFSRLTCALFLLYFEIPQVSARPWHGAQPTNTYRADEWSPRPTHLAAVDVNTLFARPDVNVDTCGWIQGDVASPMACGAGSSCVYDTLYHYVGCCTTSGPCMAGVYTSCVDENSNDYTQYTGWENTGVQSCPSGSFCNLNAFPSGYAQYSCGPTMQPVKVETTYSGQPASVGMQIVFTGISFTPSSVAASATPSTPASTPSSTPNPAAPPVPLATVTLSARQASHVNAIVGGVVGFMAAATILAGVIFYILTRRHAKRVEQQTGSRPSVFGLGKSDQKPRIQRQSYSPDECPPSMTQKRGSAPSTVTTAYYSTSPLLSDVKPSTNTMDQTIANSPPTVHSGDIGEEVLSRKGEFEEFSAAFNEVARHHQPRPGGQPPEYNFTNMKQLTDLHQDRDGASTGRPKSFLGAYGGSYAGGSIAASSMYSRSISWQESISEYGGSQAQGLYPHFETQDEDQLESPIFPVGLKIGVVGTSPSTTAIPIKVTRTDPDIGPLDVVDPNPFSDPDSVVPDAMPVSTIITTPGFPADHFLGGRTMTPQPENVGESDGLLGNDHDDDCGNDEPKGKGMASMIDDDDVSPTGNFAEDTRGDSRGEAADSKQRKSLISIDVSPTNVQQQDTNWDMPARSTPRASDTQVDLINANPFSSVPAVFEAVTVPLSGDDELRAGPTVRRYTLTDEVQIPPDGAIRVLEGPSKNRGSKASSSRTSKGRAS